MIVRPYKLKLVLFGVAEQVSEHPCLEGMIVLADVFVLVVKAPFEDTEQQNRFSGSYAPKQATEGPNCRLSKSAIPYVNVGYVNHARLVALDFFKLLYDGGFGRLCRLSARSHLAIGMMVYLLSLSPSSK